MVDEKFLTYEEILEEYRRRQMIEHLTGPVISLLLHVIVIALFAFFLAGREIVTTTSEIEFDITEMDIQPLDPELLDRLEDIDPDIARDVVPTIQPPQVEPEAMDDIDDFAEDMALADLDLDFVADLDVRPSRSPLVLPGIMSSRGEESRREALDRFAGRWGRHTEAAVINALEWLKANQNPDGSWSPSRKAAMSGLAILTFLAHNETPANSERYGENVRRGIEYLVRQVMESGYDHQTAAGSYTNGIVAYSLSEAYAMTRMPFVKSAMEKAVSRIVEGQQDNGGFDYGYSRGEDHDRWDLSVSAWQIQALKAAYMAGAEVDGLSEAMERAVDFLKTVAFDPEGGFGYTSPGGGTPAVQGGGTLGLQLLGEGRSPEAQRGVEWIDNYRQAGRLRWSGGPRRSSYAWYYLTQAIFHAGARYFRDWNNIMAPMLVRNQRPDGSWEAPSPEDSDFKPYYNTTLNAMSLMVYYRFLPTFQDPGEREETTDIFSIEEDELSLQ